MLHLMNTFYVSTIKIKKLYLPQYLKTFKKAKLKLYIINIPKTPDTFFCCTFLWGILEDYPFSIILFPYLHNNHSFYFKIRGNTG